MHYLLSSCLLPWLTTLPWLFLLLLFLYQVYRCCHHSQFYSKWHCCVTGSHILSYYLNPITAWNKIIFWRSFSPIERNFYLFSSFMLLCSISHLFIYVSSFFFFFFPLILNYFLLLSFSFSSLLFFLTYSASSIFYSVFSTSHWLCDRSLVPGINIKHVSFVCFCMCEQRDDENSVYEHVCVKFNAWMDMLIYVSILFTICVLFIYIHIHQII